VAVRPYRDPFGITSFKLVSLMCGRSARQVVDFDGTDGASPATA
jgi:hypothetical protein